jgi:hypothetical protein
MLKLTNTGLTTTDGEFVGTPGVSVADGEDDDSVAEEEREPCSGERRSVDEEAEVGGGDASVTGGGRVLSLTTSSRGRGGVAEEGTLRWTREEANEEELERELSSMRRPCRPKLSRPVTWEQTAMTRNTTSGTKW